MNDGMFWLWTARSRFLSKDECLDQLNSSKAKQGHILMVGLGKFHFIF